MDNRQAHITRETSETNVNMELNLDGRGDYDVRTGVRMFDHLLSQLARHGTFDLKVSASGSDTHHVTEDVAIVLGKAFNKALGERRGIVRMGHAVVPMDDSLSLVAVDIGGRGYAVVEVSFDAECAGELPLDLVRHFLETFASEARLNIHARVLAGVNDHHKAESLFKALGRALDAATRIDGRITDQVPSTKDVIQG